MTPSVKLSQYLCSIFVLLLIMPLPSLAEHARQVLVIESYHASFKWDADYRRAIQDTLGEHTKIQFFEMDTKRLPANKHIERADAAWNSYLDLAPDLVILGDDNALKYLGPRFAKKNTPVIYLGINNNPRKYFDNTFLPRHISGILERPLMKRSVLYLEDILGQPLEKVLILFDTGTTSSTIAQEVFQGKDKLKIGSVEVQVKFIDHLDQWHKAVKRAPIQEFDAVIIGLYHTITTVDGKHVPSQEIIRWTSKQSSLPLFSFWEFSVGKDMTIGGLVLDGYSQGKAAATLALQVLQQHSHNQRKQPIVSNQGQFVFSRYQLEKWKINLPQHLQDKATYLP